MNWKFWKKPESGEVKKLPKPKDIPPSVGRQLVVQFKQDPDWVWSLKSVERHQEGSKKKYDVRVFDETETRSKGVRVLNYETLDQYPQLVLFEGWFDKESYDAHLEQKRSQPTKKAA